MGSGGSSLSAASAQPLESDGARGGGVRGGGGGRILEVAKEPKVEPRTRTGFFKQQY